MIKITHLDSGKSDLITVEEACLRLGGGTSKTHAYIKEQLEKNKKIKDDHFVYQKATGER